MRTMYDKQGDIKQLAIDSLPLRTYCKRVNKYYDTPLSRKHKHVRGCDAYDNAHQLVTFNMRKHNARQETIVYVIDNGNVSKYRSFIRNIVKQGLTYIYDNKGKLYISDGRILDVVQTTKANAQKLASE